MLVKRDTYCVISDVYQWEYFCSSVRTPERVMSYDLWLWWCQAKKKDYIYMLFLATNVQWPHSLQYDAVEKALSFGGDSNFILCR